MDAQLQPLGKQLKIQAEIDSVDAIGELVLRGPWATPMQPRDNATTPVLQEMIEAEFARLTQRGVFSFASTSG